MEKVVKRIIKLILTLAFLYNLGAVTLIKHLDFPNWKGRSLDTAQERQMLSLIDKLVVQAKLDGEKYSPDRYFSDLIEVEKKKRELPNAALYQSAISELTNLSLDNSHYSAAEIDRARAKYTEFIDPGSAAREKLRAEALKKTFWPSIFNWLLKFYLKNMILAFFLLWLWWYQEKKTIIISNPLSFIITLLLYPFTIGRVWYLAFHEAGQRFMMETTLRRTKVKIFNLISSDELAVIRNFAKEKGLKEYKLYLHRQNLVIQHSFFSALLVTLITVGGSSKIGFAQTAGSKAQPKCFLEIKAPPNTTLSTLTFNLNDLISTEAIKSNYYRFITSMSRYFQIILSTKTNRGYYLVPEPVPLSGHNKHCTRKKINNYITKKH